MRSRTTKIDTPSSIGLLLSLDVWDGRPNSGHVKNVYIETNTNKQLFVWNPQVQNV